MKYKINTNNIIMQQSNTAIANNKSLRWKYWPRNNHIFSKVSVHTPRKSSANKNATNMFLPASHAENHGTEFFGIFRSVCMCLN